MGSSSAPATAEQVDSMRALVDRAMREGAFGVGSGLFYAPQSYSSTDEVIRVVSAAKPYGGVYDSHQRDESSYSIGLLNSVREAIRIGRESGLTTNIGHVKALGVDVWGYADSVLRLMREARAQGHMVIQDHRCCRQPRARRCPKRRPHVPTSSRAHTQLLRRRVRHERPPASCRTHTSCRSAMDLS
jgi:N-acyl-D-aspartate/D-glutamate deacylase